MTEVKAVYYGQVKIIPGIVSDGYVLNDHTAVMSGRGVANLLDMNHAALIRMVTKGLPNKLNRFNEKGLSMVTKTVEVTANNCPYKGRSFQVYDAEIIESLISMYALALAYRQLREN